MTLSDIQHQTLQAAIDRVIPADDYPGGCEAGVREYILRQLDGELCAQLENYRQGLDNLNAESTAAFGCEFWALDPVRQDELLGRLEMGRVSAPQAWTEGNSPREFFSMLIHHCAEGYYSDPGNGGNIGAKSWEMIGFDPVRPVRPVQADPAEKTQHENL